MSGIQERATSPDATTDGTTTTASMSTQRGNSARATDTAGGAREPREGHVAHGSRRQPRGPAGVKRLKQRLMLADLTAAVTGAVVAFVVQGIVHPVPPFVWHAHVGLFAISLPAFAIGAAATHMYQARANERPSHELGNIVKTVAVGMSGLVGVAFALQYKDLSRLWVALISICVTLSLAAERHVARRVFNRLRVEGKLSRKIVIVGTDAHALGLLHTYERSPELGYEVVGFVGSDDIGQRSGVGVLGDLDELLDILDEQRAVGVVVSLLSMASNVVNVLTRQLTDAGYHVALSSSLRDIDLTRVRPQQVDGRTLLYVEPVIRTGWRARAKRAFDVMLASTVLVLSAPIMAAAAVLIKLDSSGPVVFKQIRVGRHGDVFTILKLRTMTVDAERRKASLMDQNEMDGPLFKMENDPRITRVGRVLRKLSIDELPQLISVLQGTMSMVGPRPALPDEVADWEPELHERLRVLPGITGMWQVSGRSGSSFEDYKRYDLYYVDNWSLVYDVRICAKTIGVVLTGRGAS